MGGGPAQAALADESAGNRAAIVAGGGVPLLVQLLSSGSKAVQEQAAWAVASLTGRSASNQAAVVAAGVVPPLVTLLRSSSQKSRSRQLEL